MGTSGPFPSGPARGRQHRGPLRPRPLPAQPIRARGGRALSDSWVCPEGGVARGGVATAPGSGAGWVPVSAGGGADLGTGIWEYLGIFGNIWDAGLGGGGRPGGSCRRFPGNSEAWAGPPPLHCPPPGTSPSPPFSLFRRENSHREHPKFGMKPQSPSRDPSPGPGVSAPPPSLSRFSRSRREKTPPGGSQNFGMKPRTPRGWEFWGFRTPRGWEF